jgi:4-amino-4-deoxy-L-arabinose transferase-like glycosyltransferase
MSKNDVDPCTFAAMKWSKIPISFLVLMAMVAWGTLPRLAKKGLFGDGLLYASMSRNMAEGRGSIWQPYFSSSYWIEGLPTTYYENPPLMIWVQSWFFRLLGDYWYVEKVFCGILLAANILVIKWLWENLPTEIRQTSWLPAIFWLCIPISVWGNVNNMMDNFLFTWCAIAIVFLLKSMDSLSMGAQYRYCFVAGLSIFLGILTKGPVALYPLALPGIMWILKLEPKIFKSLRVTLVSGLIAGVMMILLFKVSPEAKMFFTHYWEQRLKAVIVGTRSDLKVVEWERLYILGQYLKEVAILMFITLCAVIYLIKNKRMISISRWSIAFLLLSLAATLPIIASTKQSGIYIIPGVPMVAIAVAVFFSQHFNLKGDYRRLKLGLTILILTGCIYAATSIGKYSRHKELIQNIERMTRTLPPMRIGVCESWNLDFIYHTYLQRIGKYELRRISDLPSTFISSPELLNPYEKEMLQKHYEVNKMDCGTWTCYRTTER